MNAIDRVKELLAAATAKCDCTDYRCEHRAAAMELSCNLSILIAEALVESQEALASRAALREHETSCDACWNGLECRSQAQLSDDNEKKETAALRLDGLAKAMKR